MAIKFNEINIPSFIKVNDIKNSVLPSVTQNLLKVTGKAGNYDFGNDIGNRKITMTVSIISNSQSDLKAKIREFASWLYYEEYKKLVILSESDKYYLAKVTGESELDEILHVGKGTIEFTCSDPFAYSEIEKQFLYDPIDETPVNIINNGNTKAFPKFTYEFTQDTTNFSIIQNDKYMYFGEAEETENIKKNTRPLIFSDTMTSLLGWNTATAIDDGVISGNIVVNGERMEAGSYGTGTNWHGPSLVKSISKELQDFHLSAAFAFNEYAHKELGKIEIYLLDANGIRVGKLLVRDGDFVNSNPFVTATIGSKTNEKVFYNSYNQNKKGYWKDWYYGNLKLERKGNKWTVYAAQVDTTNGKHIKVRKAEFIDNTNIASSKIAQVQIHFGSYNTNSPINTMYISHINIYELLDPLSLEIPIIFKTGDILEIDSKTGSVLLNGERYFTSLDPASQFPILEKGDNAILITPAGITQNGVISFNERWL